MVNYLMCRNGVGNKQACRCVRLARSMYYYRSRMEPLTALRQRVRELAHARVRFGYRRTFPKNQLVGKSAGRSVELASDKGGIYTADMMFLLTNPGAKRE